MQESSRDKIQKRILRISMIATIVLIASVIWVNYERNIAPGDKTLDFEKELMPEIFEKIEESYRVEIVVQDSELSNCLVTAKFVDKTLEEVLRTLEFRYKFKLERINKRKFVVSAGECK